MVVVDDERLTQAIEEIVAEYVSDADVVEMITTDLFQLVVNELSNNR